MNYVLFFLGITLGFLIYYIPSGGTLSGRREKKRPSVPYKIYIDEQGKECYHLHHWVFFTYALIALLTYHSLLKKPYTDLSIFAAGIFIGAILDGLLYSDRMSHVDECYAKGCHRLSGGM
jgi:hypothetical protein